MATKKLGSVKYEDLVLSKNSGALVDLGDINGANPSAGRVLAITGAGTALEWIAPGGGATSLGGLTDVLISSVSTAQILIYDGANDFRNRTVGGDATLGDQGTLTISANAITSGKIADSAVTLAKLADDINNLFAKVGAVEVDAEASNERMVHCSLVNLDGNVTFTSDVGVVAFVRVSDSNTDAEPSAAATIEDAGDGTCMEGAGSATAILRQASLDTGRIRFKVKFTGAGTKYVWVWQGPASQKFLCQPSGVTAVSFV